ncbi:hypothetical protein EBN03_20645 [Nocardia stercoris]|uniref:Uncharacterized protein n=1 Tax=Nocardia stercoris TaxID=2483361 RepID=A0A3M2KYA5_9NOCA|nr:hypothetical protein EBN03_20645 [Nocardia stercoris]
MAVDDIDWIESKPWLTLGWTPRIRESGLIDLDPLDDTFGRWRLLLIGIFLLAVSSAVRCGRRPAMMVAGRFGQRGAEAVAPASLGMIALLFTDPKERNKAWACGAGLVTLGGTLDYIVGGS